MHKLFDTHCHLSEIACVNPLSLDQLPTSIEILTVSTQPKDWLSNIELALSASNIYGAIGLHPWFVEQDFKINIQELSSLLDSPLPISAIGEIGLDFSAKFRYTRDFQIQAFKDQLNLAQHFQLPVSLHCYKAHNEMLHLLKQLPCSGFMHGFTAGSQMAREFTKLGMAIGVNGVILNNNARRYHQMVQEIGLEHLVLETDAPYGMNLPEANPLDGLMMIAKKISDLLGCSVDEVCSQTRYNAQKILKGN